jgi:uncharacterized membrane protein HdeD (DUF308 family)
MANGISAPLLMLSEFWWALALRGLVGILVGLVAFFLPLPTLTALVWLFGAYAFVDGVFNLIAVWRRTRARPWWALLLEGIAGVAAGVISFLWPGITAIALVYLVAAWALITGVLGIISAIRLRKEIKGEWLLVVASVLSVLLGVVLAIAPGAGAIGLVWYFGAYAMAFGVLLVVLSFRLRSRYEEMRARLMHVAA